ncbi:MAG: hypothetical protein JWO15_2496 [Sphingomonadales bacterium]|nr:hypothetical protein [Sphingomonadales bacterium]
MISRNLKLLLAASSCLAGAGPLLAQNIQQGSPASSSTVDRANEDGSEITVTAQRRNERYVDVPSSVSVISASQLQQSGITTSTDLSLVTPGLNITKQGTYVQPTIRGVGTTVAGTGADPNIAIYVDGVYMAGQGTALFEFNNIEQIEVLKGPQGALYGRNATGGAIVVTTRTPSLSEFTGNAEVGYGRFDDFRASAYVNVPVSEKIAFNLSAYDHTNDGYTRNLATGRRASYTKSRGVRGKLLIQPSEELRVVLSGAHIYQSDNTAYSYVPINNNTIFRTSQAAAISLGNDRSLIALNTEPVNKLDFTTGSLKVDWSPEWGTLTSISSYAYTKYPFTTDLDGTEVNSQAFTPSPQTQETITQELVFASPKGDRFNWVGGLFYLHDLSRSTIQLSVGGVALPFPPFRPVTHVTADAYAAYAEGTFNITPRLHLTAGGRYSSERKQATNTDGVGGVLMLDASHKFNAFTPRAALRYDVTPQSSAYLSYSQGFKSGLFDSGNTGTCTTITAPTCPSAGTVVEPEKVRSYEVGYKYSARGLTFSAAGYYTDYKNIQINALNAFNNQILFNAASAKIYGMDAEMSWRVGGLDLRLGGAYNHSKYDKFPTAQIFTPRPTGGNIQTVGDGSGNRLVRSPRYTAFGSASYKHDLGGAKLESNLTVSYSSSYFWNPDNRLKQSGFAIVNARLSYLPTDSLKFSVFGDNLTNKRTQVYVREATVGDFASYSKPRTWGVSAGYSF